MERLPKAVLEKFSLQYKVQLFFDEQQKRYVDEDNNFVNTLFLGIDTLVISYSAQVSKSNHYMLKDDPHSASVGSLSYARLEMELPKGTTHYVLGRMRVDEGVTSGKNKTAWYNEHFPIVFLKAE